MDKDNKKHDKTNKGTSKTDKGKKSKSYIIYHNLIC